MADDFGVGNIFTNYLRAFGAGYDATGQMQTDARAARIRNALGSYQQNPDAARNVLAGLGAFDELGNLNTFEQNQRANRMRAGFARGAHPGQAAPIAKPGVTPPPAPTVTGNITPQQAQQIGVASTPAPGQAAPAPLAGGAPTPQGPDQVQAPAQAQGAQTSPGEAVLQQSYQQSGVSDEMAYIDNAVQVARQEGDIDTAKNLLDYRRELEDHAHEDFNNRMQYLGQSADQLKAVPPAQRLQAAVQMIQNSPFAQGADGPQLMQFIRQRLDPNNDGVVEDQEIEGFKNSLLTVAQQRDEAYRQQTLRLEEMHWTAYANATSHQGGASGSGGGPLNEAALASVVQQMVDNGGRIPSNMRSAAAQVQAWNAYGDYLEAHGDSGGGQIARQQAVTAAGRALGQLETTRTMVGAAEASVERLFPRIEELSRSIPRTGTPALNRALMDFRRNYMPAPGGHYDEAGANSGRTSGAQALRASGASDEVVEYYNLITEATTEYGKVLSGAYGAGGVSDSQIAHAAELMNAAQTPEQMLGAIAAARQAMQARMAGYQGEYDRLTRVAQGESATDGNAPGGDQGGSDADANANSQPGFVRDLGLVDSGVMSPEQFAQYNGMSVDMARRQVASGNVTSAPQAGNVQVDTNAQGQRVVNYGTGRNRHGIIFDQAHVDAYRRDIERFDQGVSRGGNPSQLANDWARRHTDQHGNLTADVETARNIVARWDAEHPAQANTVNWDRVSPALQAQAITQVRANPEQFDEFCRTFHLTPERARTILGLHSAPRPAANRSVTSRTENR